MRVLLILILSCITAVASYKIENIALPPGVDPQVGGMAFMPDGRLAVCFHHGEVYTYETGSKKWQLFAEGLHEPLGLLAVSNTELLVMQRPELTRLIDSNNDGKADFYKTAFDGFGMSGNYHEFAFGPVKDGQGNIYIALNVASNGASIRKEIRGEFNGIGLPREEFYKGNWKKIKAKAGRMYARVPYRGWVLKIDKTGKVEPFACGVRSPNGLGFDAEGRLFVTDNQGDWLGTSKLYHVEKGRFYGHPASLIWKPNWKRDPLKIPVEELDAMRTKAAGLFPQGILANSPTQPLLDTSGGKFGPFSNQMFVGDMNFPRIMRFLPDVVEGEVQGTILPFITGKKLKRGCNRLAFAPDGSLWVGHTHLSWAGSEGLQRIVWSGETPFDVKNVTLKKEGFQIDFTKELSAESLKLFKKIQLKSYFYRYHQAYGSKRYDETVHTVDTILSNGGKRLLLKTKDFKKGYVYQFGLGKLTAKDGTTLRNELLCYFLKKVMQ